MLPSPEETAYWEGEGQTFTGAQGKGADLETTGLAAYGLLHWGRNAGFTEKVLTGLVRSYIERKTGIHAPEQTTEEFLRDPATGKFFVTERAARLGQFLEAADMVKYAAQQPGGRDIDESVERAREFIGMPTAFAPMPMPAGEAKNR